MFFGGHLKSLSLDKTRLTASESIGVTPVLGVSALPFGTSSVTADRLGTMATQCDSPNSAIHGPARLCSAVGFAWLG